MKRRGFVSMVVLPMAAFGEDRVSKQNAVEIATGWVRRHHGGLGPHGKPLQFDKGSVSEGSWKNSRGEARSVWFVHFPEQGAKVEPNGIGVRVDKQTGDCERAAME